MTELTYIQKRYFDLVQNMPKEELVSLYLNLFMDLTIEQHQSRWLDALADFYAEYAYYNNDSEESAQKQKEIDEIFKEYCSVKQEKQNQKDQLALISKIKTELNKIK